MRYEINVAENGLHLFATDRHVRSYSVTVIAGLILRFQETFPESEVSVTVYDDNGHGCLAAPYLIQAALSGEIDRERLAKTLQKERDCFQSVRHNDYVGGAEADYAEITNDS